MNEDEFAGMGGGEGKWRIATEHKHERSMEFLQTKKFPLHEYFCSGRKLNPGSVVIYDYGVEDKLVSDIARSRRTVILIADGENLIGVPLSTTYRKSQKLDPIISSGTRRAVTASATTLNPAKIEVYDHTLTENDLNAVRAGISRRILADNKIAQSSSSVKPGDVYTILDAHQPAGRLMCIVANMNRLSKLDSVQAVPVKLHGEERPLEFTTAIESISLQRFLPRDHAGTIGPGKLDEIRSLLRRRLHLPKLTAGEHV